MCNLNILINKQNQTDLDYIDGFISATALSYNSNSDAEGLYIEHSNTLLKDVRRLLFLRYLDDIQKSKILIDHTRISTSGRTAENTQPFDIADRFVVVHNGILGFKEIGIDMNKYSDTYWWCQFFNDAFKEKNNVKGAIELAFEKVTYGSYSIGIFDKVDNVFYYFKNGSTSIYAWQNNDVIYFTTNKDNDDYFCYQWKTIPIKNNTLYVIPLDTAEIEKFKLSLPQSSYRGSCYPYDDYPYGYGRGYRHNDWSAYNNSYTSNNKQSVLFDDTGDKEPLATNGLVVSKALLSYAVPLTTEELVESFTPDTWHQFFYIAKPIEFTDKRSNQIYDTGWYPKDDFFQYCYTKMGSNATRIYYLNRLTKQEVPVEAFDKIEYNPDYSILFNAFANRWKGVCRLEDEYILTSVKITHKTQGGLLLSSWHALIKPKTTFKGVL